MQNMTPLLEIEILTSAFKIHLKKVQQGRRKPRDCSQQGTLLTHELVHRPPLLLSGIWSLASALGLAGCRWTALRNIAISLQIYSLRSPTLFLYSTGEIPEVIKENDKDLAQVQCKI